MSADASKQVEFLALAGKAFNCMFGSDQQNGLVTFAQREERACQVSDELARWLMAEHVARDRPDEAVAESHCPICQGPLEHPSGPEVRELMTRRGKIALSRTGCRCPRCRRLFFPPG